MPLHSTYTGDNTPHSPYPKNKTSHQTPPTPSPTSCPSNTDPKHLHLGWRRMLSCRGWRWWWWGCLAWGAVGLHPGPWWRSPSKWQWIALLWRTLCWSAGWMYWKGARYCSDHVLRRGNQAAVRIEVPFKQAAGWSGIVVAVPLIIAPLFCEWIVRQSSPSIPPLAALSYTSLTTLHYHTIKVYKTQWGLNLHKWR